MTDHDKETFEALAHEIWAVAQLAPGEGIVDGVDRIVALLRKEAHPAITHCDNCGCDWLDNGLNPIGCPYCKQSRMEERVQHDETLLRQVLEVLSRTHQTAMEQAMKARVLEGVVFAEIFQDLDFVVATLRERLGEEE